MNNPIERTMNYEWDGRIDWAIIQLSKANGITINKSKLKFAPAEKKVYLKDLFAYYCGRYPALGKIRTIIMKVFHIPRRVLRLSKKGLRFIRCLKKNNTIIKQMN